MGASSEEMEEFKIEAVEMLDEAEGKLMSLDKGGEFKPTYDAVFRVFHSLKGASGFLGLEELQHHMHQLESQYQELQNRGMSKKDIGYFLSGIDGARKLLESESISFDYTEFGQSEVVEPEMTPHEVIPVQEITKVEVPARVESKKVPVETVSPTNVASPRKKFFGRFLVERGLISELELVLALIEQLKSVPPIPEILLQEELMTAPEISRVFDYQARKGCDFLTAAVALKFWNDDCSRLVNDFTTKKKTLLGEILISRGLIKFEVLVDVLDDFINTPESDETREDAPIVAEPRPEPMTIEPRPAQVKSQSFFNTEKLKELLNELLVNDGNQYLTLVSQVREELRPMGAKRVGIILLSLHELISRNLKAQRDENIERLKLVGEFALSLVWDVVGAVQEGVPEEEVLKKPEHLSSMSHLIQIINEMKSEQVS